MMKRSSWFVGLILLTALTLLTGAISSFRAHAQEGVNLLTNGAFEGDGTWPMQDNISEIQVAPGWRAFWLPRPPSYAQVPEHCSDSDRGCYWATPEFRDVHTAANPERVRSGQRAQKYFSFGRQHEAGLMQQVNNITPGTPLRFQAYVQTWSCQAEGSWNNCPTRPLSNNPSPMHTKVGIDPTGGDNPWAATVIWGPEINAYDNWTLLQVEATAEADKVTVFIYSRADWTDGYPRINNDVYIDDASLVTTAPPATPTEPPPPPPPTNTPGPSPTPLPPPTPRPDGASVHIVQPGDTLFGIALQYGVPVEQIEQLNAGSLGANNMIWVGQELVISIPSGDAAPAPETEATAEANPAPEANASEGGSVCILAYHDRNGDTFRQADTEELLPNAVFSLADASGLLGQYTSDGVSEPYCFQGLSTGTYRVMMQPPPGYVASGSSDTALGMGTAERMDVAFGMVQGEASATEAETASIDLPEPEESSEEQQGQTSTFWQIARWTARISGALMLVAAVGMAGVFVAARNRQ